MTDRLCPVVIGRAAELDVLRGALDTARRGAGSVVFLLGEAGIGKSRLARELVAAARAAEMAVLRGRAVPGAETVALGPLAEALMSHVETLTGAAALDRWLPALSGIVPGVEAARVDSSPAVRGEAIARALGYLSRANGGLLVIEDLHWADPDTLAVVEHFTDHIDEVPVLCLVTVRSEASGAGRDLVRTIADRRSAPVLELARLSDAEAAEMVQECVSDARGVDVGRIVDASDGIPFLIEELLASPGVPKTFADTVHRRLEALSPPTRAVLSSAATLGRHFDWRLLTRATGLDESQVADALEHAQRAQLLTVEADGFCFRHALTRDAVLDSVLPPRRQGIAAAALDALVSAGAELDGPDRELAASLAERAGQSQLAGRLFASIGAESLASGALASASIALARATGLLAPGQDRTAAALNLIDALAYAGRVDDALAASGSLLAGTGGDAGVRTHLSLARAAMAATRWELAASELDRAVSLVDGEVSPALMAQVAVRHAELAIGTGNPTAAVEHAERALAGAGQADLPDVACEALLLVGRAERAVSLERAQTAFSKAAAIAEANHLPVWRLRSLHELGTIDMLERGEAGRLLEARRLAGELGALATAAVIDLELSAAYSIVGNLDAAIAHGLAAAAGATSLGQDEVVASAHVLLTSTYVERGQRDLAADSCRRGRSAAPGNAMVEGFLVLSADGLIALIDEERTAALAAFEHGMRLLRDLPVSAPASLRGLWPLLLAVARDPDATAAIDEVNASGACVNRLNLGYLQLARAVLAGRHDPAAARALATDGDGHLAHGPFWRQLGRRLVIEAAAADGWGEPSVWAGEAADWFAERRLVAIGAMCERYARSPGRAPAAHWAFAELGISRRESDVLTLVREGLANKEIAERLYLSPRTVEKHIESLLRKTSSRSRTQLATLATHSTSGAP